MTCLDALPQRGALNASAMTIEGHADGIRAEIEEAQMRMTFIALVCSQMAPCRRPDRARQRAGPAHLMLRSNVSL
jgi:hypothetical protein